MQIPQPAPLSFQAMGIIPAAGRSVRMGRPKLLMPWRNHTILDEVLSQWEISRVAHTFVVAGELAGELRPIAARHHATLLAAQPPPVEMIDSIRVAITALSKRHLRDHDAILIAPADHPRISAELINATLASYDATDPCVVRPTNGRSRGHPVLIPWRNAREVMHLAPHETLRDLVAALPVRECYWPDERAWADVDTLDDYRHLQSDDD